MRELQTGLWHWEAPYPDWKPGEEWDQVVSSYAIDDGDRLLLFDPLAPPSEIDEFAAGRETAIVLTCPWHVRDARSLAERLGAPLYCRRHAHRPRPGPRVPGRLGERGRAARADPRGAAPAGSADWHADVE